MLIIVDKTTRKVIGNMGTNSLYPDGDIPGIEPKDNEIFVRLHDEEPIAKRILELVEFDVVLGDQNELMDVVSTQTFEEAQRLKEEEREALLPVRPSDDEMRVAEIRLTLVDTLIELGVV